MSDQDAKTPIHSEGRNRILAQGMDAVREVPKCAWKAIRFAVKPTLVLWLVFLVGISAIILSNFNYIDDMGRVAFGYKGWEDFSRYTSNFLSSFVHAGGYLFDISPLPQMLAALELAIASFIVIYVMTGRKSLNIWLVAAILPLGLSPYFLECLAYKFDSPYMALSVLASVAPLLFSDRKKLTYCLAVFVGELIVCTTYQAAAGILPIFVLVIALRRWCAGEGAGEVLKFVLLSAGAYLAALVVFKFLIMQPTTRYVSNDLPPIGEIPVVFFGHLETYINLVFTDFRKPWIILLVLVIVAFIWIMVRDTKRNRIASFLITIACLAMMICLTFGMYPLLDNPLFTPRAMYGVGAFIAFLAVVVASSPRILSGKLVILALSWCFFVFAFVYGNALYAQAQWTEFRVNSVIQDLDDLPEFVTDTPKTIRLRGDIGLSPILRNQPQNYQMLNRLVPHMFDGGWVWGTSGLENYYGLPVEKVESNEDPDTGEYDNLPILEESVYHTIYGNGERFLIVLK